MAIFINFVLSFTVASDEHTEITSVFFATNNEICYFVTERQLSIKNEVKCVRYAILRFPVHILTIRVR